MRVDEAMLTAILCWLNDHPERWVPLASIAADSAKKRWPASARVIDAIMHLLPNLPAAYRALRGGVPCRKPCERRNGRGEP